MSLNAKDVHQHGGEEKRQTSVLNWREASFTDKGKGIGNQVELCRGLPGCIMATQCTQFWAIFGRCLNRDSRNISVFKGLDK